ncbi:MAG: adenine deaminase [Tepidisphaeraceae bacterium]
MDDISRLLAAARGDAPSDVLITGGRVINVFNGEIESVDIALLGNQIAGIGSGYHAKQIVDLKGSFIAPGLIDAHVHIESSLCTPAQFAAGVVPRGVTTVVTDPHEIANVAGAEGVRFMATSAKRLPLNLVLMAPSCVPATPMASGGGAIDVDDLRALREQGIARGLAEVMNYRAVTSGEAAMLAKIATMKGRPVDGHCPAVTGRSLNAYVAAGVGSDHEATTVEEAREKLARGMYLLVREATNARNLATLLPAITPANSRRICFCTDDRTSRDLLDTGSIDEMVRRAIAAGIDPVDAIRMATLNPAEWFGLDDVGAIGPGRMADLIVFDDLQRPQARMVFSRGVFSARDGVLLHQANGTATAAYASLGKCDVAWDSVRFAVPAKSDRIRVIGSRQDQLITEHRVLSNKVVESRAVADVSRDVLKMAVIERHRRSGGMGVGFIQGFGMKRGAIAGTVAHDHHNLVTIGSDDVSMLAAAHAAAADGGGLAVAVGENIVARLPLPIGGLMSDQPIGEVAASYRRLIGATRELGSALNDPFMAMSFMALEVIPSLKLTDHGLIDVEKFKVVDLFV